MNKDELQRMMSLVEDVWLEEALDSEKGTKTGKFGSGRMVRAAAVLVAAALGIAAGSILLRPQPGVEESGNPSRVAVLPIVSPTVPPTASQEALDLTNAATEAPAAADIHAMGGGMDSFDRAYRDEVYNLYCCYQILGNEVLEEWVNNVYLKKSYEERNKAPDLYQAVHELGITKEQLMSFSEEMKRRDFMEMCIPQAVIDGLYLEDFEEMRKSLMSPFSLYYEGEIYTMSEILSQSGTQRIPQKLLVSFLNEKKGYILELCGEAEYKKVYEPSVNAILKKEDVDYKAFFLKASESVSRTLSFDYTLEQGGMEYRYEGADSMPGLPFSTDAFSQAQAHLYYAKDETHANCLLQFANEETEKYLSITISSQGTFYSCFPIDEEKGEERFGTVVYGFDFGEFSDGNILELYFRHDGLGYGIASSGLSYEEMGAIMDGILLNGLNEDAFDRTKAINCSKQVLHLALSEAVEIPTFAGFVPDVKRVGSMTICEQPSGKEIHTGAECSYYVNYENDKVSWEGIDILYQSPDLAYLMAHYGSGKPNQQEERSTIFVWEFEEAKLLQYENPSDRKGAHWYSFTLADEHRHVRIAANCTREELLEYVSQIVRKK